MDRPIIKTKNQNENRTINFIILKKFKSEERTSIHVCKTLPVTASSNCEKRLLF